MSKTLGHLLFYFVFTSLIPLKMSNVLTMNHTLTLHLIGDSTMAERDVPEQVTPERGWGQTLHRFLSEEVRIVNHAVNGRSSKSFIDEGRWEKVLNEIKPGDYVIIQFGHNDQKQNDPTRYTNPVTGYYHNLKRFVEESRNKEANPVFATPIIRRKFNEFGTLTDTHGLYPLVMKQVANEMDVPLIDLQYLSERAIQKSGPEDSKSYFTWLAPGINENFPDGKKDDTHLSQKGAMLISELFIDALEVQNLSINQYITTKKTD